MLVKCSGTGGIWHIYGFGENTAPAGMYHTEPVTIDFLRHFAGGGRREHDKGRFRRNEKRGTGDFHTGQGGCKFCGQITALEVPSDWTAEMCNELATELCGCLDAEIYTRKKRQKEKAVEAIEEQFGDKAEEKADEEVIGLLASIAELVIENQLNSGTLDMGNGRKAKIAITTKGLVKVERTMTEKGTKEV